MKNILSALSKNNTFLHGLSISILISLAMKLILVTALFKSSINNDGTLYITAAQHYANGEFTKGLSLYPMPIYPLLLVFVHFLIPDWIISGYVISITSMVLATIPLYYLTKTLFGIKPAFWACIIFAFLPEFNEWSLYISRDSLFLFVFGSCIYSGLKSLKTTNLVLFILTFILAWISILIRIEGVLFIFFYFCTLVLSAVINRELKFHFLLRSILWAGIPLCIAAVVSLLSDIHGLAVNRFDQVCFELGKLFNGNFTDNYNQIYNFFVKAENHAPFSGRKFNFAALTRHYMLIIYLFGIIEIISKIIFPFSYIPMIVGLKNKIKFSDIFILCLGFLFILLVFYSVLTRDFIVRRFLMIPSFLLLPWVGLGLDRLCRKISTSAYKKLIVVLISIIVLAPAIKTLNSTLDNDNSIPLAAQWLNANIQNNKITIVTNQKTTSLYVNLEKRQKTKWKFVFYNQKKSKMNIENFALKKNADIIIVKMKNKKLKHALEFKFYKELKSIGSRRYTTNIYDKNIK